MSDRNAKTSWSKSMPFDLWPEADGAAWQASLCPGDVFGVAGVASRWSEATRRRTMLGWGRYFFFLYERGELDPMATPAQRITEERLGAYLAELQRANRGHTPQQSGPPLYPASLRSAKHSRP